MCPFFSFKFYFSSHLFLRFINVIDNLFTHTGLGPQNFIERMLVAWLDVGHLHTFEMGNLEIGRILRLIDKMTDGIMGKNVFHSDMLMPGAKFKRFSNPYVFRIR